MRVLTWNLRTDTATEPPHWPERLPVVAELLGEVEPHVIATQEGSARMLDDLAGALPSRWTWVGEGRRGGRTDEFTAVFYDTARFDLLASRTTWLSDRPDLPGTLGWGAAFPRTATTVRLRDLADGTAYTVVNTHLDHVSAQARAESARLIAAGVREHTIVLGDFNAPAELSHTDGPYAVLLASGLRDSLAEGEDSVGTFTAFEPPVLGAPRIDWVLVTEDLDVELARVVTEGADREPYASDHLPVVADLGPRGMPAGS